MSEKARMAKRIARNNANKNKSVNLCSMIKSGSYDCYENTDYGQCVDKCLVQEINYLNAIGIKTIGCCCGHNRMDPYIQVSPSFIPKMKEIGYIQRPIVCGNGQWCFYPKTKLPSNTGAKILKSFYDKKER